MNQTIYDIIDVIQFKPGWVECPRCDIRFELKDRQQWSGRIHRPCGQRLKIENYEFDLKYIWAISANVTKDGTSRYDPGTKVFLFPPLWGDGYESIKTIGKDKETKKFIEIIVNHNNLENFRAVKITKSDLISRLCNYWDDSDKSKMKAEEIEKEMAIRLNNK